MSDQLQSTGLEQLLAAKEIVITCGPGGVGKTTTAAALAASAAALTTAKVLVVTVDPARRLADALGVGALDDEPRRVPSERFTPAGVQPTGELWAAMLDSKRSWDALVTRHAPDEATRIEILANPLYANITGRFARAHEYIAMERLYELHSQGNFDLIIVDTPPTRDALGFLDAPEKMAEFFASGLLRWLIAPYRSRLVNLASRPFYQIADRILGTQFLADIARFFTLFQTMHEGFIERAQRVTTLVHGPQTTFVVVTTLETVPVTETNQFIGALLDRRLRLGMLVANKVLPAALRSEEAEQAAEMLCANPNEVAASAIGALPGKAIDAQQLARVLNEVGQSFLNFRSVANREAELLTELSVHHELTVTVPQIAGEITDLSGLVEIGERLFGRSLRGRKGRSPRSRAKGSSS